MDEYAEIEANRPKILASGEDLADGIFLYDSTIGRHDATAIFREAYKKSPILVNTFPACELSEAIFFIFLPCISPLGSDMSFLSFLSIWSKCS